MRNILLTSLLSAAALPALCQQPRVTEIHEIPEYVLYDDFFRRVSFLEDIADRTRSQGQDDSGVRSQIDRQAGLTPDEAASLKRVVRDWKARTSALRSATPSGAAKSVPEEHRRMMAGLLADLKAALPAKRFAQLDAFVRVTSTARWCTSHRPRRENDDESKFCVVGIRGSDGVVPVAPRRARGPQRAQMLVTALGR